MEFTLRYNLSYEFPFLDPSLQPWEPTIESGEYIARTDRSGRWCARIINPGVNCDQDNVTRGGDNLTPLYEMSLAHYRDRMNVPSSDYFCRGAKGDCRRSWARQSSEALQCRIPKSGDSGYN